MNAFGQVLLLAVLTLPSFALAAGPNDELLDAAEAGDGAKLRAALAKGADVNHKTGDGTTALMLAAASKGGALVGALLERGAKVDEKDGQGITAFLLAVDKANTGAAKLLLAKGASIDVQEKNGRTPLMIAVIRDNAAMVKLLLEKGANLNLRASDGKTALLYALYLENFPMLRLLVGKGADVNVADAKGNTALLRAAQGCDVEVESMLGAKPASRHEKRCPKEMKAALELLLDKGANVNARNADGFTPLLAAISAQQNDLAKRLLARKADPSGVLRGKRTALMLAAAQGDANLVRMLIDAGADLNARDFEGVTAFKAAAQNGHRDAADLLRQAGGVE